MTKYAIRGGGQVNLTQANFIAAGGEGQVFGHGDEAFKVYLKPERMIPEAKIGELAAIADESVIRPRRVLLDARGAAVGYSMRRVADAHPLCQLFTRAFRDREGVDGATVLRLVRGMQRSMGAVHAAGVLVVDANEMNFLVARDFGEVLFIDVDSYQTRSFPATALMEGVKDWSAGGRWTAGSDWFSWGVVTFQLWVGIHPYKGKHPSVKGLPERMRANLSVFNRAVSVPQMVPPFDVIPGAYRAWYKAMFEDGFRGLPPADAQISTALGTARPVASATQVNLTLIRSFGGDILEYVAWSGEEAAIVAHPTGRVAWLLDGGRNREVPVAPGGHLAHTAAGVPLYAWLDRGDVHVRDLRHGGAEVPLTLRGRALATAGGRVYVHSGESVVEIEFFEAGGKLMGAPRVVANVAPLATQLYPGVAMQSVLGAWYANLFPASGRSDQVRLADLDGSRVIGAHCEGPALLVLADRGGSVDRYVYGIFSDGDVQLRWVDRNVGHGDLNFVALPKGVVAMIDEAGELALFPARGSQQGKRISDPAVADLRLAARGDEVVCWRGGQVFRLSTR